MERHELPSNPLVRGSIDEISGDTLRGWIFGAEKELRPLLFVDDEPARLLDAAFPRPDVCAAFGVAAEECPGFVFKLPPARAGARVRLYGVTPKSVYLVAESELKYPIIENNLLLQLERAAKIASQKDAVGIVCWDGAHNAIGRARTLYEIASTQRPSVLICYLHVEFGGRLWAPLINWTGNIIAIPWNRKNEGHALLARYGINFSTVWICKPRVPSFMLASAISRQDTRFVLDIDDNEDAFFSGENLVSAGYDTPGANLAKFLIGQVAGRTVSGPVLQKKYGGQIVRHARKPLAVENAPPENAKNIVFCGTVRPHQNVTAIARSVNILAAAEQRPLHFHVYGDIQPPAYSKELKDAGAILHGSSSLAAMKDALARADVLISGFFSENQFEKPINQCQVPAKISDALAAGKPILVPISDAVEDLREIPGIYVFDESNFLGQLLIALKENKKIFLPPDFSPEGAYAAFAEAEKQARQGLNGIFCARQNEVEEARPALVLVWKQHDAGLYGRRIDQMARSYKKRYPNRKVIILEFIENGKADWLLADEADKFAPGDALPPGDDFCDEKFVLAEFQDLKKHGLLRDGIKYRMIAWESPQDLRKEMALFLEMEKLFPANTLFVLFPVIEILEEVEELLRPFGKIVDVVDNQLAWAKDNFRRARIMAQYFGLMQNAQRVVFNNPVTRDFFVDRNFVSIDDTEVIPNWYSLPGGIEIRKGSMQGPGKHIFYSGNMNDRLDWDLLREIASLPDVKLHLAGTASQITDKLNALIAAGAIYHGVTNEKETLALLQTMDAAIIPHVRNEISRYMHPIKAGMYQAVGLPVICPDWLDWAGENFCRYSSKEEALQLLQKTDRSHSGTRTGTNDEKNSVCEAWLQMLRKAFSNA